VLRVQNQIWPSLCTNSINGQHYTDIINHKKT